MARPSKYTPDATTKIEQALSLGAYRVHAAAYAGITDDTFTNWMARYPEFSDLVKRAEGRATVGWLAKIEAAANDGVWQAAAWKLERRYPQLYGRKVTEVSGEDGGAITVRVIREQRDPDRPPP